jgi:phosphoglycerate dehydrogenase-like enzyme
MHATRLALLLWLLPLAACAAPGPAAAPRVYLTTVEDPQELQAVRAACPGLELIGGLDRDSALEHASRAQGIDAGLLSPQFLANSPALLWIQAPSAGVEHLLRQPGLAERPELVLTNAAGVHGPVIAEHVFALLLSLTRGLPTYARAQARGEWDREGTAGQALAGRTLLVAGLGGIGDEVARRGAAFDMTVLATVRTPRERPPHVDELVTGDRLDELLPRADVLVICLPLTDQTRGLFDARRLALLPQGAYLINIARGAIVDTEALVAALHSGHLAGAGLDVTDPEPLPAGHALWTRPDVLITPHVASDGSLTDRRRRELWRENLRRFGAGEGLLNVVDRQAGY